MSPHPRSFTRAAHLLLALAFPFPVLGAQDFPGPALGRIVLELEANVWKGQETLILLAGVEHGHSCAGVVEPDRRDSADVTFLERWHRPANPPCDIESAAPTIIELPLASAMRTLVVRHLGAEDRWRIAIGNDAIHVTALGTPRVSLMRDTLIWRTQRNTLRVTCGANDMTQWYCVELYRTLADIRGLRALVIPRAGRLPLDLPAGSGDPRYERDRIYRYDDDQSVARARAALRRAAVTWGSDATMQLWTSARWSAADTLLYGPQ